MTVDTTSGSDIHKGGKPKQEKHLAQESGNTQPQSSQRKWCVHSFRNLGICLGRKIIHVEKWLLYTVHKATALGPRPRL